MSTRPLFPQLRRKTTLRSGRTPIPVRMPLVITVIGKPGSGKSTLIELLAEKFQSHDTRPFQIYNDRDVLVQMAQSNTMDHLIRPRDAVNFEILDERAYDVAIDELITTVSKAGGNRVSLIEFSRNDYIRTFRQFHALLANKKSLVVYVKTPFEICSERNVRRALFENAHSVPLEEMESYFRVDDAEQLVRKYPKRVTVVSNELQKGDLLQRVDELWLTLKDRISLRRNL